MTTSQKYLPLFQSKNTFSPNQSTSFISFLTNRQKNSKSIEVDQKIIKISPQKINEELKNIQWRKNTEFPIVKVINYQQHQVFTNKKAQYSENKIHISIYLEPIMYKLTDVDQIPIFKMLYIIKQTLIAAERLSNLYGNFLLKPSMIAIDFNKRCKVWHNSNFYQNNPQFRCKSQKITLRSMIEIFYQKTKKSTKTLKFYQQFQKCKNFWQSLNFLKKFTQESKIRIPPLFLLVDDFSSNMCSPRKFISRQPSYDKTPSTSIQKKYKNKSPLPQNKITSRTSRLRNDLNLIKHYQNTKSFYQEQEIQRNSALRFNQSDRNIYDKFYQFNSKQGSVSKKVSNQVCFSKLDSIFIQKNNFLCVVESVFEGDSNSRFSQEFTEQPEIRVFDPIIPTSDKNTSIPTESSTSLGGINPEIEVIECQVFKKGSLQFSNKKVRNDFRKKLERVNTHHPLIRII